MFGRKKTHLIGNPAEDSTFGDCAEALRKSRGLTVCEFAEACGFEEAQVREWEEGESQPGPAEIARMLDVFSDVGFPEFVMIEYPRRHLSSIKRAAKKLDWWETTVAAGIWAAFAAIALPSQSAIVWKVAVSGALTLVLALSYAATREGRSRYEEVASLRRVEWIRSQVAASKKHRG